MSTASRWHDGNLSCIVYDDKSHSIQEAMAMAHDSDAIYFCCRRHYYRWEFVFFLVEEA